MSMSLDVSTPEAPDTIIHAIDGGYGSLGTLSVTIPYIPGTVNTDHDTVIHDTTTEQFKEWYHATPDAPHYFSDLYEHVMAHPEITVLRFEKMY